MLDWSLRCLFEGAYNGNGETSLTAADQVISLTMQPSGGKAAAVNETKKKCELSPEAITLVKFISAG